MNVVLLVIMVIANLYGAEEHIVQDPQSEEAQLFEQLMDSSVSKAQKKKIRQKYWRRSVKETDAVKSGRDYLIRKLLSELPVRVQHHMISLEVVKQLKRIFSKEFQWMLDEAHARINTPLRGGSDWTGYVELDKACRLFGSTAAHALGTNGSLGHVLVQQVYVRNLLLDKTP